MTTWQDAKIGYQNKFTELNTSSTNLIQNNIPNLNIYLKNYIDKAGIDESNNTVINDVFTEITSIQNEYITLNKEITNKIKDLSYSDNLKLKLTDIGSLQGNIADLEKDLEIAKQDADISRTRQVTVETSKQEISWYQGFAARIGFSRPLHKFSVALLFSFGLLCLIFSGLLLREFFAPSVGSVSEYTGYNTGLAGESIFSVFSDLRMWSIITGVTFVVIVVGIVAASGRLGNLV